ncbi:MAG: DUF1501 domain-containing protein [Paracoccaceae bacterium]
MRTLNRRLFLHGAACSIAAHPLLTTVTLAGSDGGHPLGDHRTIVVILRGAMDGLDVVQPLGDPDFAGLRPNLGTGEGALPLDGFFALHPGLSGLMPLWTAGELAFVHATSTPYRDKRSHFDGQDLLEAGTGMDVEVGAQRDGWLNRMLQAIPGLQAETAFAVGREAVPLLDGAAPVMNWAPDQKLVLSAQSKLLMEHIYHDDDLFRTAATEAVELAGDLGEAQLAAGMMATPKPKATKLTDINALCDFAGRHLLQETRIAAFSLSGWDTHRNQLGTIAGPLTRLQQVILRLKEQLGPKVWGKTTLMAMTEFGRTAAENGSRGTDHGTAGAMVLAGGALKGGRVLGQWPGLSEAQLYVRRDLMPTSDVRAWAGHALRSAYGLERSVIETSIFPGLILGDDPGLLL